ncbi:hypothetical protein EV363DRAFT_1532920 [Boletus edulis]|nr:hypothetical protein EV363DRAFT_1532920 [Boletus edulis]
MSSLVSELETFQLVDYMLVAAAAIVCYDYILIFPREVELIWMKPWSKMSTLFVMVRYIGLALAMILVRQWRFVHVWFGVSMILNSYLQECLTVTSDSADRTVVFHITQWTDLIYIIVADVIMILRVSAMFTGARPERIRRVLFFLYAIVTVNSIVFGAIWYGPSSGFSVKPVVINAEDGTACRATFARSLIPSAYDGIPRGLFDILLLALAIYRFAKHCIETRSMMGKKNLKVNKYMMLLLEHSLLYFVLNFTNEALEAGTYSPSAPTLYLVLVLFYQGSIPFMIYPRLVLSMRDQRATSGGLLIGSEGSGYPPSYGHHKSPSVPVAESREHEVSEGTSTLVSQHARPQSC